MSNSLYTDEEWVKWSDREIAKHARCDHKTVASVRSELNAGGEIPHVNIRTGSDGKTYTQDVPPARPVAALVVGPSAVQEFGREWVRRGYIVETLHALVRGGLPVRPSK